MDIPADHPRHESLRLRHLITEGLNKGIVAQAGLIAHGRGEAYDYLLGEATAKPAQDAQRAAVALILASKKPVISVNGNVCALCPKDTVDLAKITGSRLEINLFYRSEKRIRLIYGELMGAGADRVYGVDVPSPTIPNLSSERSKSDEAILESDTVLVMLEDGDRTEKLIDMGKNVIAVDLNPLSRTAKMATISIVDNVVRALPNMISIADELSGLDESVLSSIVSSFDNQKNLAEMEALIRGP